MLETLRIILFLNSLDFVLLFLKFSTIIPKIVLHQVECTTPLVQKFYVHNVFRDSTDVYAAPLARGRMAHMLIT